jgi:hypothetical protein
MDNPGYMLKNTEGAINNGQSRVHVKEYRRGNQKWTIQGNWQHRRRKTKQKHNTICVGHH